MFSKLAKFLLVITAVAPIMLTWAFADWRTHGARGHQVVALVTALGLAVVCWLLLVAARSELTVFTFTASSAKHADSEVVGFLIAYLLPLVSIGAAEFDHTVLTFVAVLMAMAVWTSEAYSFNPLLTLFDYHFYEVESTDGVAYMLITRNHIRRCSDVHTVVELTRSVLLDITRRK